MEFNFNVNRILPKKINRVIHSLIPDDFRGDRRDFNEYHRQISRILDQVGEASAIAQGLSKPITSAVKLRDTDHIVYILVDHAGNGGLGSVLGFLKTGSKNLFMFDETGKYFQLKPRCILDFYIHETRQRMGFGKDLYQHMLTEEKISPVKLAIDRPSEKFLQFLNKHYGLQGIIPQNNKFVVFQGFFDNDNDDMSNNRYTLQSRDSLSSSYSNNNNNNNNGSASSNGHSAVPRSGYGRYAATRPPCSMANIIHNTPVFGQTAEREIPPTPALKLERPRSLNLQNQNEVDSMIQMSINQAEMPTKSEYQIIDPKSEVIETSKIDPEPQPQPKPEIKQDVVKLISPEPTPIQSFITVHNDDKKSEMNKSSNNISTTPSCAQQVTGNQSGHLDLKFYHSPLW